MGGATADGAEVADLLPHGFVGAKSKYNEAQINIQSALHAYQHWASCVLLIAAAAAVRLVRVHHHGSQHAGGSRRSSPPALAFGLDKKRFSNGTPHNALIKPALT